jgi:hypothetical protein
VHQAEPRRHLSPIPTCSVRRATPRAAHHHPRREGAGREGGGGWLSRIARGRRRGSLGVGVPGVALFLLGHGQGGHEGGRVIPRTGTFFVTALRLLPAGALLVAFAAARGRKQPSGWASWFSVAAFALADAAYFQVLLACPRAQCSDSFANQTLQLCRMTMCDVVE